MATLIGNLHPKWLGVLRPNSGEGVQFDCPVCKDEKSHPITVYFENPLDEGPVAEWFKNGSTSTWRRSGSEFKTLSLAPSIQYPCFHGWVEIGHVFRVQESPIVVMANQSGGQMRPIALSPLQTIEACAAAVQRAKVLLGDAYTGETSPCVVVRPGRTHPVEVWLGDDVMIRGFREDDGDAPDILARMINIYFGYLPDEPIEVERIERLEKPPSNIVIARS